jgi:beta-phosphoglucomutase-like phosphatase (HAD superfamily)
VVVGKPDPSIYRLACQRLSLEPRSVLAVEDAESGIQAANGAGVCCIGVAGHRSQQQLRAAGAAHVVKDFTTLSLSLLDALLPDAQRVASSASVANIQ